MLVDPHRVHYRYDDPALFGVSTSDTQTSRGAMSRGLSQAIRVSDMVLPRVFNSVRAASHRVASGMEITAFVYASPDMNARSVLESDGHVLIFVSSGMVTNLTAAELSFGVGHELGHVIHEHFRRPAIVEGKSRPRQLELARAGEIAADRVGLIGCADLDVAASALLKAATGLPGALLDVDVAAYVRQARDLHALRGDADVLWATHPPMLLRLRALLRFQSVLAGLQSGTDVRGDLSRVDDEIFSELNSISVDNSGEFGRLAADLAFWEAVQTVCSDGSLSRSERSQLETEFGTDRVESLLRLLAGETVASAMAFASAKVLDLRARLAEAPVAASLAYRGRP